MANYRSILTARFYKTLVKERIPISVLRKATNEIKCGLADALGHKFFKKRIALPGRGKRGGSRAICYYRLNELIIMVYLYAKNDKENLDRKEMQELAVLAKEFDTYDEAMINKFINSRIFIDLDLIND